MVVIDLPAEDELADFDRRVRRRLLIVRGAVVLIAAFGAMGVGVWLTSSAIGMGMLGVVLVVFAPYLAAVARNPLPGPDLDAVANRRQLVLTENRWARWTLFPALHTTAVACAVIGFTQLHGDRGGLAPSRFEPTTWLISAAVLAVSAVAYDLGFGRVPDVVFDRAGITRIWPHRHRHLPWNQIRSIDLDASQLNVVFTTADGTHVNVKVHLYRVTGSELVDALDVLLAGLG
ncbi:hypothetical protein [Tsukamurella soli]|uniref:PH domain-containing protein n=1 Tax=Tsukamurella soli TaxID=644556 RepID=A0ABP8JS04_9ACTN